MTAYMTAIQRMSFYWLYWMSVPSIYKQRNNTPGWFLLLRLNFEPFFDFESPLTLSLFMLGIFTDDSDTSLSLDDLAFITNGLYR